MRYAMMIDLDLCVGCSACVSACKEQWDSGPGAARDWVHEIEHGTRGHDLGVTFYPGLCMQCEDHPCTTDCPTGATFADENGVIVVDGDTCIGCGNCVSSCPYGARHVDAVKGIVEKCNLCAPLVARGEGPACVQTCLAECRIFGDLDDPGGPLVKAIAARDARSLVTASVDVRPKVTFAGASHREAILASGAVRVPERSTLTNAWTSWSLPLASRIVPAISTLAIVGGLAVNALSRRTRAPGTPPAETPAQLEKRQAWEHEADERRAAASRARAVLPRHRAGLRALHWFNALSWLVLLATGTLLLSAPHFAFFGTGLPHWARETFGGAAPLLSLHAVWGLVWAAIIVPAFLVYKRGGVEALREIRFTRDDLRWMTTKPLAMLGLAGVPLPPQDKYNAGQKAFAMGALVGTTMIIASGLVMTFHVGGPGWISAAIIAHQLAIAVTLLGVAIHLTMAAIIREERPALKSMVTGVVDRQHAAHHNAKWVKELEESEETEETEDIGEHPNDEDEAA